MTERPTGDGYPIPTGEEGFLEEVSSDSVAKLLAVLERDYAALLARLSAKLGSPDAAADALHDAYVKLRSLPAICDVRQPHAYLYRMAMNLALNSRRKDTRTISAAEIELEALPDGMPDPERSAIAVREMEHAFAALHAFPPKRREIFLARWRDEKTNEEIATAFGMHKRSVQKILAQAEASLRQVLGQIKIG